MTHEYPLQEYKGTVPIDVEPYKHSPHLFTNFYHLASLKDWTHSEIEELRDFLHGKLFEEQISILKFYCFIPMTD